jgi:carbon starvation protein
MFDPNPLIGFLAHARQIASGPATADLARRIFNDRLDTVVCALLLVLVSVIVIESARQWISVISGRRSAVTQETPFVATGYAEESA